MAIQQRELQPKALRIYTFGFHLCWILIVAWAAARRFYLPPEPLTDRDVWGYLSPALLKILGRGFVQSEGRGFLYPGYVYLTLLGFRSLNVLTVIQHVLGLGTGALMLVNWTAARRLLPRPLIPFMLYDVLGLGMLAVFLFSAQSVLAEHHLRSEGLAPFFAVLAFSCTIQYLLARHVDRHPTRALWFGAASLAVSFLLPLLKPSYTLTTVLTTLPVWSQVFDRKEKWARKLVMAGGPLFAALILLWIPEHRYAAADTRSRIFLPESLFTIHAPQIRAQIAADLAANPPDLPYTHEQLQSILSLLDAEIEISRPSVRRNFASLGFNPDYLLYDNSFCRKLQDILPERNARGDFYQFYFRRTWRQQPGAMLQKIVGQLGLFYNLDCPVYIEKTVHFDRNYRETYAFLSEPNRIGPIAKVPPALNYLNSLPLIAETHSAAVQPKILLALMPVLARSYLPLFLLALAAIAWLLAAPGLRVACGWFGAVVAAGYAYNVGNNLAIACFHTLGVGRYAHVQLATTLLTQMLALCLLVEIVLWKMARIRERAAATSTSGSP